MNQFTEDIVKSTHLDKSQHPQPPLSRVQLSLFAALSLLAGIALFFLVRLPEVVDSLRWPITRGTLVSSEVVEIGLSTDANWYPLVSYRYSIDGKDYTSDDVEVIRMANGNTDYFAKRVVLRYPVGEEVEVHYAPNNPAMALLEPGVPDNDAFTLPLFLAGVAGGVLLLCAGLLCIWGVLVSLLSVGDKNCSKSHRKDTKGAKKTMKTW